VKELERIGQVNAHTVYWD